MIDVNFIINVVDVYSISLLLCLLCVSEIWTSLNWLIWFCLRFKPISVIDRVIPKKLLSVKVVKSDTQIIISLLLLWFLLHSVYYSYVTNDLWMAFIKINVFRIVNFSFFKGIWVKTKDFLSIWQANIKKTIFQRDGVNGNLICFLICDINIALSQHRNASSRFGSEGG